MEQEEKAVITSCAHNCMARCILKVHVRDNRVVRISTDSRNPGDNFAELRACLRGRAYRDRLYNPNRLKFPLKRVGRRGEGNFTRISWDEATTIIAGELQRITKKYGARSRYVNYGSGIIGTLSEKAFFKRLLSVYGGGFLDATNSYSNACVSAATPYTFGSNMTSGSRDNWLHSKLIILWGHNPAETSFGTNTAYYLLKAKENGARIIVVDPRCSDTAAAFADQWIPLLPTTDNALMDAMLYVMITEEIYDKAFVDKYCLGFAENRMPAGIPPHNSLSSYILGLSDGTPKTPAWAEKITRVPAETIVHLAREYATNKPAALIQGWGPQRHAYGEQPVRGAAALAAVTGNIGILGGWAAGSGDYPRIRLASIPYEKANNKNIPVFTWPEAVLAGELKFMASLAGNCLINQHADINATKLMLQDESLCEFILVSDEFMTASAKFADILLPSTNFLERTDLASGKGYSDYIVLQSKAVEPEFERRDGYDWMTDVARKLGVETGFTQGKTSLDWVRYIIDKTREDEPSFPTYEELAKTGIYYKSEQKTVIPFREQIEDPAAHPFPTPSGKIELFSPRLYALNNPGEIPALPKYIASWEGPEDPLRKEYPLQLIGWHSKRSTHSTLANSAWLAEAAPHELWINPEDAEARQLKNGERVHVYNQRGRLAVNIKITSRIIPGVVAMPQGAWYDPDEQGVDQGGCINTLTKYHPTPLAKGNPQHTNLVQIEKIVEKFKEGR